MTHAPKICIATCSSTKKYAPVKKQWGHAPCKKHNFDSASSYTPWKFNIAPENIPSQKESSLPTIHFQGQAVKLRGCIQNYPKAFILPSASEHRIIQLKGHESCVTALISMLSNCCSTKIMSDSFQNISIICKIYIYIYY